MLKPREKAEEAIQRQLRKLENNISGYKKNINSIIDKLNAQYGIPFSEASDLLSQKTHISTASDFELYAIMNAVNENLISEYFTPIEIKKYSKYKIKKSEISFPIEFNVIQVAEDQWLGSITVKQLMLFRDTQFINYNENTQRTMTRVNHGIFESYKITLNRKAVEGIKKSYKRNAYIPNAITLNLPDDAEFDYDEDENKLIITNISHFDILDGYHRYIAMSELTNEDADFDYTMELRLVSFSEEKAKQFIWQEDQKTKMSKADSATFNQYKASNIIAQRLNSGALRGIVNNNGGIIDTAVLTNILDYTYLKGKQDLTRSEEISLAKKIGKDFEKLEESNPSIFDSRWDREYTICVVYCLFNGCFDADKINVFAKAAKGEISTRLNQRDISRLDSVWKEV